MSFAAVLERLKKLENPYPGLRHFETEESRLFFGRDQQIAELVGRLERNRFVAVVGVSGSGKSSLVRAGLIPALERGRVGEAGTRWRIVVTRPAGAPFERLGADLSKNGLDASVLRHSSHGLIEIARQLTADESLLVVIDQFEELFRYKDKDPVNEEVRHRREVAAAEAAEFVQLLLAAGRFQPPVYIILTMRSDYLGDCAEFRDLPETLNDCQYLVPRLTREQRKQAIEGPLGRTEIAPSLVQRMLNDAGDEPDQLPILQHALMRTWGQWRRSDPGQTRRIELQDYEAIGGFADALDEHADELLKGVPEEIAATIFKRLTARGHGNREHRDPATLSQLWVVCGAETPSQKAQVTAVIDHFRKGEATFLSPRMEQVRELGPNDYVDITHESLIRQWKKLRDVWMVEETNSANTFLYLVKRAGRETLTGLGLTEAVEWNRKRNPTTAWASHYADEAALVTVVKFIEASQAEEQKRIWRGRRNFWIAVGMALLFAVLAGAAWYQRHEARFARDRAVKAEGDAKQQRNEAIASKKEADKQRDRAVSAEIGAKKLQSIAEAGRDEAQRLATVSLARQLAARSELANIEQHVDLEPAALLATEAMMRFHTFEADLAMRKSATLLPRQAARFDGIEAISPDFRYVATKGDNNSRVIRGTFDGRTIVRLAADVRAVVFSADSRYVATGDDNSAQIFEVAAGREILRLQGPVDAMAFSLDGRYVAMGSPDDVRVFERADGKEIWRRSHRRTIYTVAFSRDGRYVATGSYQTAQVFDAQNGNEVLNLPHRNEVRKVTFSPDGRYLVTNSPAANVFEIPGGKAVHQGYQAAFSNDGHIAILANGDRTVLVLDRPNGRTISHFDHEGHVIRVAFSPDGQWLATGSDKTARVFDWFREEEVSRLIHPGLVEMVVFSQDGKYVATDSSGPAGRVFETVGGDKASVLKESPVKVAFSLDGRRITTTSRSVELDSGREIWRLDRPGAVYYSAASSDGRYVAVKSDDGNVHVFRAPLNKEVFRVSSDGSGVYSVAATLDDHYVAIGEDHMVRVLNGARGTEIWRFSHGNRVKSIAFSPDGRRIVSGSEDNTARVFDVVRGKEILRIKQGRGVTGTAFSPDGRFFATASADVLPAGNDAAVVFDAASGREISHLTHPGVSLVTFSADGRWVATGGDDKTSRVFEAATGKELSRITLRGPVYAMRFDRQGRYLMTASSGTSGLTLTLTRHLLRSQDFINDVCSRLTRNLTQKEWRQYVGAELPYHRTCPDVP